MTTEIQNLFNTKVSSSEFNKLSKFINTRYGIKLPPEKKVMLQSRLHKRLRSLNMTSFDQYINYLFSKEGSSQEEIQMMNVVSTNKTEFFRESAHFDFISEQLLPQLTRQLRPSEQLKIWSAGCSSGEEVYTMAMVLEEYFRKAGRSEYHIIGTDISTKVLTEAANAVYCGSKVANIPMELKKRYLLKSKEAQKNLVRVIPSIRNRVQFSRLNFMDSSYEHKVSFDIVFCRNVLIYFERDVQETVINKICKYLKPGGYLFLGHSESITKMNVPLAQIKPTVFIKNEN